MVQIDPCVTEYHLNHIALMASTKPVFEPKSELLSSLTMNSNVYCLVTPLLVDLMAIRNNVHVFDQAAWAYACVRGHEFEIKCEGFLPRSMKSQRLYYLASDLQYERDHTNHLVFDTISGRSESEVATWTCFLFTATLAISLLPICQLLVCLICEQCPKRIERQRSLKALELDKTYNSTKPTTMVLSINVQHSCDHDQTRKSRHGISDGLRTPNNMTASQLNQAQHLNPISPQDLSQKECAEATALIWIPSSNANGRVTPPLMFP